MPTRKVWDHTIDLKETFKPQKERIYPLSKNEREEVQNFVKDQLRKNYIRPSKLPQTSLVFFVGKKDRSKRIIRGHLGYCLVSPVSLYLLRVLYPFVYCVPIVPYFSCLCYVVQCLLFYSRTIVITDPCACNCP